MRRLIAIASVLALAGCASLPTGLNIETGPELTSPDQQEIAFFSPSSPLPGATPSEIVNGFLAAGTGPQNDYGIAREFLTETFATRWRPGEQTLIRSGAYDLISQGDSLQVVSLTVGAKVDEFGRYESSLPTVNNLRFRLAKENGEWRITSAPNLTVVTLPVFGVVFSQFPIYFLDSTSTQLVPDLRWFPKRASIATQLAGALLNGPARWLSDSVVSAIPAGTQLQVNAVLVQEGVAIVDLDANAIAADNRQRGLLLAQLKSTLLQLPGVIDVVVSIAGAQQDIEVANITALPPTTSFALTGDGFVRLSGSEAGLLVGSDTVVQELSPRLLASGKSGEVFAIANSLGVYRLTPNEDGYDVEPISDGGGVVDLQIDIFGNIWIFRDNVDFSLEIVDQTGATQQISFPFPRRIISAAVSPEGGRLALLASDGIEKVSVFGIIRNQDGLPLRLASSFEVEATSNRPVSLTWSQPTILRVLEKTSSGGGALVDYPVTGPKASKTSPPVPGLVIETGLALIDGYLLSENQDVWILSNNAWRRVQTEVQDLSTGR
jgi:hypothetical protein